jgi:fibronectin-binding autotransporter adhesin
VTVTVSTLTVGGVVSGAHNLTVTGGSGTLALTGNNTYTGTTTITGGSLSSNNFVVSGGNSGLGNAATAVIIQTGGILSYTGNSATFIRGLTISSGIGEVDNTTAGQVLTIGTGGVATTGGTFTVGGSSNTTLSSAISGTGNVAKTGTGTFTLGAAQTISGVLTINAGTVQFDATHNLAIQDSAATGTALSVAAGGSFFNNGTGSLTLSGGVTNNGVINFNSSNAAGNGITIDSNNTTHRNWQGTGDFIMQNVTVGHQDCIGGTPASITAYSSTDNGTNTNWTFNTNSNPRPSSMFQMLF